jgi:hypothetical protein
MLVQILRISGCRVVGVVGGQHKVDIATRAGCDAVVDYKGLTTRDPTVRFLNLIGYLSIHSNVVVYVCVFFTSALTSMLLP